MKNTLLTSLLFILTACGRSAPHEKVVDALKTTYSWTATAEMVGQAWQQGTVPDQYAQQTLIKSQEEIGKAIAELSAPPVVLQQVQQAIRDMSQAVEHHNKAAIAASLKTISVQQQRLRMLAKAEGAQL